MKKNYEYIKEGDKIENISETEANKKDKFSNWFLHFAIIANAISMMSTDIHLPVLHEIAKDLNTSYFTSQLILVVFYTVGIIARVILGPMSDSYGRRKVMIFALDIQIVGQAMQAFASNIEILLLGRVVQALASGGITILISAVISDLYKGKERTKMLSFNEFVQPLSFVIAPIIGGLIATNYGWRGGFVFLLLNLIIARIVTYCFMVETNTNLKVPSVKGTLHDYKIIMRNREFMSNSFIMAFIVSAYMLYAVSSAYTYIIRFGLPIKEYMIYQSIPLLCQAFIAFNYTRLGIRLENMIKLGIISMLISGLGAVFVILGLIPYTPITVLMHISVICIALGLVFPACMKKALDKYPDSKGVASSSIVVIRGILSGIAMLISGLFHENDKVLFISIVITSILTFTAWLYSKRNNDNVLKL